MSRQRRRQIVGFTLLQLLGVLGALIVLVVLMLPTFGGPRGGRHGMPNNAMQLRSIHQGMFIYAQSNKSGGSDGYYPGLDSRGDVLPNGPETDNLGDGTLPHVRMWLVLKADVIPSGGAMYAIAPADRGNRQIFDPQSGQPFGPKNHSYAMLSLLSNEGEGREWRETDNTNAVVLSDRAIRESDTSFRSVWVEPGASEWKGTVTRNDGSTSFETTPVITETKYGSSDENSVDHLFLDAVGAADAFMVHENGAEAFSAD